MRELLKQYLPYFKEYKKEFSLAIIGMIAIALGTAGTAHIIKPVMDDIFIKKDINMLYIVPFALIFLFALKGVGRYMQTYYTSYIGQDVIRKLRDNLLAHITRLDISFFKAMHSGELLSRITNDIMRIQQVVTNIIPELIRESLTIVALVSYILYQSPKLALYFLVIMPLAIFPLSKLAKKMRRYSKLSQESTAVMTERLEEVFSNIEMIKANSSQDFEQGRFEIENKNVFRYIMKQIKVNALTSPVMELLGSIAIGLVLFVGGKEVINGHMSVGGFFAFSAALFMLYDPIRRLSSLYNKSQDAITANNRMKELLALQPNITGGTKELQVEIQKIILNDVSLDFNNIHALSHVSLTLQKGSAYALVGDSGAGKSSLVNLLVRLYDPTSGSILLNDDSMSDFSLASLHGKIGYVTQNILIFNDTIAANIAYGKDIDKTKVISALKKAHAFEFVSKLDDGIESMLAQRGSNLSGGQRQRIALARALYKDPDILILDEATSALDNKSERYIKEALEELKQEMITISVAHRLSSIQNADKIFFLKDGKVLCEGTHDELSTQCSGYQELLSSLES
ncbi:MAG: ABC transporter ATP-binding protein [Sulfurovaceae bacterium]